MKVRKRRPRPIIGRKERAWPLKRAFTRDPAFGLDPWNGPGEPIGDDGDHERMRALFRESVMAPETIYSGSDTLSGEIDHLIGTDQVFMSYVDNFGGFGELEARFPTGVVAGLPWGYTSASNMASLIANGGGRQFVRWSAHYGFGPHICGPSTCGFPQSTWTQWADTGPNGENIDRSLGTYLPAGLRGRPLLVPITIFGNRALCADMEPGAMQIGEFGGWYDRTAEHPAPLPRPVTITIPEDPTMVSSSVKTAKNSKGEVTERIHYGVLVPKVGKDYSKGFTLYEVYQQEDGIHWTGGTKDRKALAYKICDIPA